MKTNFFKKVMADGSKNIFVKRYNELKVERGILMQRSDISNIKGRAFKGITQWQSGY